MSFRQCFLDFCVAFIYFETVGKGQNDVTHHKIKYCKIPVEETFLLGLVQWREKNPR